MKNNLLFVLLLLCNIVFAQQVKTSPIDHELLGNWCNAKTNEWNYGFFEDFALVNGVPKFYDNVTKTKKGYTIRFKADKKLLKAKIANNQLVVGSHSFDKINEFLPNYTGTDDTKFLDTKFAKQDTAVISGYIRNNKSKDPFSVAVKNWLTGKQDEYYGDIDDNGLFTVKVPLNNTTEVYMDWERSSINDVLTPGEHYFLFRDLETKEQVYFGDNARLHNEMAKYGNYKVQYNIYPKTGQSWQAKNNYENALKDTAYLQLKLAQLDSLKAIDDSFIKQHNPAARTQYFIDKSTDFSIAFDLIQKKDQLDKEQRERFTPAYINTVTKMFIDNNMQPLSLVWKNNHVITDYLSYMYNLNNSNNIYDVEIVNVLINAGEIVVTDTMKTYTNLMKKKVLHEGTPQDSIDLVLIEQRSPNLLVEFNQLVESNLDLLNLVSNQEFTIRRPLAYFSQLMPQEVVEVEHAKNIMQYFDSNPVPFTERSLQSYLAPIKTTYIRDLILDKQNKLASQTGTNLLYAESLKNTEHLKEAKEADLILQEILGAHKGKVIYVDFWGHWCGPCVAEMAYAPAAKKAFEDKDVVFVYLANSTPEKIWKSFIKAKEIEGKNVFHYNLPPAQQNIVERRLGVSSFPTYMLFNKNGELVTQKAPRPSELSRLRLEIDKLLLD